MATTIYRPAVPQHRAALTVLRLTVVGLTLATAAIHAKLGGPLFTLNAIGYTSLALLLVVPGPFARLRWLVRLALMGFALTTIGGWALFGARFPLAYFDKAIELVLVVTLTVEVWVVDGGPIEIARRVRDHVAATRALLRGKP